MKINQFLAQFIFWGFALPAFSSALELRQQGLEYRRQERWAEAVDHLQRSVSLAPKDVQGLIILGWTQHLARDRPGAITSLWRAIGLDPFVVEAANALGIVYLVEGNLSPAILIHTWAALLKPGNEIAHYNLSLAFQRQELTDWAIAHGERAMELEPYNPHPVVALAVIYWSNGEREQAVNYYQTALALDDRYQNPEYLNHLLEAGFSAPQVDITNTIRLAAN